MTPEVRNAFSRVTEDERQSITRRLEKELSAESDEGRWPGEMPNYKWDLIHSVDMWLRSGIHSFVDHAVVTAIRLQAPFTQTFRAEILAVMYQRRVGKEKGTWRQVQRYYLKQKAFLLMCNLRYHGCTISEAAQKAAVWLDDVSEGRFTLKASSIEREYSKEWVTGSLERLHHEGWESIGKPREHDGWNVTRQQLRHMPDRIERIGTRR